MTRCGYGDSKGSPSLQLAVQGPQNMKLPPSLPLPWNEWKLKVNDQYQDAIKTLANLVTASLILPILFIRNFVGLKENEPIAGLLHWQAYWSWGLLGLSLLSGISFYIFSVKYAKVVCGGKSLSEDTLERWRDRSIWGVLLGFVFGIFFLFSFFVYVARHPPAVNQPNIDLTQHCKCK